ncbi:MAG: hypothetical protein GF307_04390 [candidate division Zixibacteria bacterium]|nr:hypothetical protein [candidate division Zixibacteria bacterium]
MAEVNESNRYKYIGFGVYPGRAKEFWGSPEEEKKFKERLAEPFERDQSFLYKPVLAVKVKYIMMASSALLVLSLFLPWFMITFGGEVISVNVITFLGSLSFLGSLGAWGSGLELPSLIVLTLLMFLAPILGILYIVVMAGSPGKDPEKYYSRIKSVSKLFFLILVLWVAVLILAAIGYPLPFGDLGVEELGDSFGMLSFLSIAGVGFYLTAACSLLCSLMAAEL